MSDKIEKQIELRAPVARVWKALTDHQQFGEWFRVKIDHPFEPGQTAVGQVLYPGYEHLRWEAVIQKMEPERLFSFTWHPYATKPDQDYSAEPPTLIEFTLEAIPGGTLLRVVESGFDRIPEKRRLEAFRINEGGWSAKIQNTAQHVDATP